MKHFFNDFNLIMVRRLWYYF